jgi:hypothetical protein
MGAWLCRRVLLRHASRAWACRCRQQDVWGASMYACMYVCMYVCIYVCMHVCMYVCMYLCIYIYIYTYIYIYLYIRIYIHTYIYIYLCIRMYVYISLIIHLIIHLLKIIRVGLCIRADRMLREMWYGWSWGETYPLASGRYEDTYIVVWGHIWRCGTDGAGGGRTLLQAAGIRTHI